VEGDIQEIFPGKALLLIKQYFFAVRDVQSLNAMGDNFC